MIGAARQYELTGDAARRGHREIFLGTRRAAPFLRHRRPQRPRTFFPDERFCEHLSAETAETCNTYNMLKLTRHLFAWQPDAATMDFYERALYNDILASQDPDTGHVHLFHVAQARPFQNLFDAGQFLLVLRRHRHGKPRQIRRHHLFSRRQFPVRESVHPVRIVVAGKKSRRAAGNEIS